MTERTAKSHSCSFGEEKHRLMYGNTEKAELDGPWESSRPFIDEETKAKKGEVRAQVNSLVST